jgi:hypothetical protein
LLAPEYRHEQVEPDEDQYDQDRDVHGPRQLGILARLRPPEQQAPDADHQGDVPGPGRDDPERFRVDLPFGQAGDDVVPPTDHRHREPAEGDPVDVCLTQPREHHPRNPRGEVGRNELDCLQYPQTDGEYEPEDGRDHVGLCGPVP